MTADGEIELIAGARRIAACALAGVQVRVEILDALEGLSEEDAVRLQLAENVHRRDLDELELAEGLARLKSLYESEHPEARHGAHGGGHDEQTAHKPEGGAERFTAVAARQLGCGETKVKELLQVAAAPQGQRDHVREASSRGERNRRVKEVVRQVRKERRLTRLATRAAANAPEAEPEQSARAWLRVGDSRQVLPTLEPVDLLFTDPPYGRPSSLIQHVARKDIDTNFGDWDTFDAAWLVQAAALVKDGGTALIFAPFERVQEIEFIGTAQGLTWRGVIVWHKSNPGVAHRPTYLSSCEAICWLTRGDGYYFAPFDNAGAPEAHNFVEGPICGGNERMDHPTQKPEWLIERLLQRHAPAGASVLDPFMGVGSIPIVAHRRGHRAIGIDLDADNVGQALLRLRAG